MCHVVNPVGQRAVSQVVDRQRLPLSVEDESVSDHTLFFLLRLLVKLVVADWWNVCPGADTCDLCSKVVALGAWEWWVACNLPRQTVTWQHNSLQTDLISTSELLSDFSGLTVLFLFHFFFHFSSYQSFFLVTFDLKLVCLLLHSLLDWFIIFIFSTTAALALHFSHLIFIKNSSSLCLHAGLNHQLACHCVKANYTMHIEPYNTHMPSRILHSLDLYIAFSHFVSFGFCFTSSTFMLTQKHGSISWPRYPCGHGCRELAVLHPISKAVWKWRENNARHERLRPLASSFGFSENKNWSKKTKTYGWPSKAKSMKTNGKKICNVSVVFK